MLTAEFSLLNCAKLAYRQFREPYELFGYLLGWEVLMAVPKQRLLAYRRRRHARVGDDHGSNQAFMSAGSRHAVHRRIAD